MCGKVVIVIMYDDCYFDFVDCLLKFDNGCIVSDM